MTKSENKSFQPGVEKEKANRIPQKSCSTGRTPKETMNKHLQDKNDIITEEDFRNLNIGIDIPDDTAHHPLEISDDTERPKDEDKDPKVVTPWDLIS